MTHIDVFDPPICCSTDPVLRARRSHEAVHLRELAGHGKRIALEPWHADILAGDPVGA